MKKIYRKNLETGEFEWVDIEEKLEAVAPAVRDDTMPPIESMATQDREVFDSRSKYEAHLASHGCHIREEGEGKDDPTHRPYKFNHRGFREDFEQASKDLKYDRVPLTEQEKEKCRQEKKQLEQYRRRKEGR